MSSYLSSLARVVVVGVGLGIVAGCPRTPPSVPPIDTAAAPSQPTVAVLVEGHAFASAAARDAIAALFQERTGRPVRLFTTEPSQPVVLQSVAKRALRKGDGYDWREPACRRRVRPLLPVIAAGADVVFRVRLDAVTTTRPATNTDRTELGDGVSRMLAAVGIDGRGHVIETRLDGTVERTSFPGVATTHRKPVRWTGRRLGTDDAVAGADVRAAVGAAMALLPKAPEPRLDALARDLVAKGCPFLAYAVSDSPALGTDARRRIETAALAAMRRPVVAEERKETAEVAEPADAAAPAPGYSCSKLCSLHMVELCNGNRTLWSRHGSRWESTRCGERRPEPFLEECYRMQWQSGTYERACVRPCEETPEGHARLQGMLQHSGCLRGG